MKVRTLPVLFTVASWVLSECLAIGGSPMNGSSMNGSSMPTNFDLASTSRYHAERALTGDPGLEIAPHTGSWLHHSPSLRGLLL